MMFELVDFQRFSLFWPYRPSSQNSVSSTGYIQPMKTLTLVALSSATFATMAAAQVTTIDEGSFTITVNGARAGREERSGAVCRMIGV